jgi:hypothetical protein
VVAWLAKTKRGCTPRCCGGVVGSTSPLLHLRSALVRVGEIKMKAWAMTSADATSSLEASSLGTSSSYQCCEYCG